MSDIPTGVAVLEGVVLTTLTHLSNGEVDDAVAHFAEEFRFNDRGMGLEFKDKERLAEFFEKAWQLYPDSVRKTNTIFPSGDHVVTEWTLQTTLAEPFHGLLLKVPVSVDGTSIVRTHNGWITYWADYYDGLTSRRTALGAHFAEWVER
jgi:steroid delta-isomerase-like uncharacterized protein